MKDLIGKNAVITGSNRGIGRGIVECFAENGCDIWACARKQSDAFEQDMKQLEEKYQVKITPIYFELTNEEEMKAAFKIIYQTKKAIDILVNAAGILNADLFQMTPMKTVREVYDVNVFAPMELTQLVLKVMVRQKKGSIINISSIAGQDIAPMNCTYGSSKAALNLYTQILASEVAQQGNIRVNAIAPGLTETDMANILKSKMGETVISRCAMNRLGKVEEIANVVTFLASDKASFVNGQVIRVDGGVK